MSFNSRQYQFSDLTFEMGGRIIVGFRGLKYEEAQEKEVLYAKGNKGHSIQRGNKSVKGEVTMLQSELETLLASSGKKSILDLHLDATAVYGDPANGDVIITDKLLGLEFTTAPKEMKQGDKNMEVTLPFICLDVKYQVV